jgi:hypothetical protein
VRGFSQNIRNGNNFAVFNSELRLPFFRYLAGHPLASGFLNNFQVVGFADVLQQTPRAVISDPPSAVILPPLWAVVAAIEEAAVVVTGDRIDSTVIAALVPFTLPAVPVMVGVSPEFVRVNPATVTTPAVKVWFPSPGLLGALEPGEFVAVQVQATL